MTRFSLLSTAVASVALLALAACGESSPSESTLKEQIEQHFGADDCSLLSISKFEKLNGFPQTDGSYIVNIAYTLNYAPSGKMKDLNEEAQSKLKLLKDKYQSFDSRMPPPTIVNCPDFRKQFNRNDPGSNPNAAVFDSKINDELAEIKRLKSELPPDPPSIGGRTFTRAPANPHEAELQESVKQHTAALEQLRQQWADDKAAFMPQAEQEWKEASEKLKVEHDACLADGAKKQSVVRELEMEREQVRLELNNTYATYAQQIKAEFNKKCKSTSADRTLISFRDETLGLPYAVPFEYALHGQKHLIKSDKGWIMQ